MIERIGLLIVGGLIVTYLVRSWVLARGAGTDLEALRKSFEEDIRSRASRGENPDWNRYAEDGDRQHEMTCESLRNLATTALATGVGGTMLLLLLQVQASTASAEALGALVDAMGSALFASVMGVGGNLAILLISLPRANKRFVESRDAYASALQKASAENPPKDTTSRIAAFLAHRFDAALRASAENLPEVIRAFNANVAVLQAVAERFGKAAGGMQAIAASLANSVERIEQLPANLRGELAKALQTWGDGLHAAQREHIVELRSALERHSGAFRGTVESLNERLARLQAITAELAAFPNALGEVMTTSREEWVAAATGAHEQRLREIREVVDQHRGRVNEALGHLASITTELSASLEAWRTGIATEEERRHERRIEEQRAHDRTMRSLRDGTTDIVASVESLPKLFAEEVQRGSDEMGKAFGSRAQSHVTDLIDAMRQQNETLSRDWERSVNRLLGEMAGIVHEGLKPTLEPAVERLARISADVAELGGEVTRAIGEFAAHGDGLRSSLEGAAAAIDESSSRLSEAHDVTRASVAEFQGRHEAMRKQMVELLDGHRRSGGRVRGWFAAARKRLGRTKGER